MISNIREATKILILAAEVTVLDADEELIKKNPCYELHINQLADAITVTRNHLIKTYNPNGDLL